METNGSGTISEEYIFFNGERIARVDRPSGTAHYYFSDHLGSTSTITDPTGTVVQERCYYFPYGGTTSCTGSDPNHYKFTGKERDTESGNDYFGARYYTSNIGRFMSPDPLRGTLADPQTLNMYAYVRNNPTNLTDPTGMQCTPGPAGQCVGQTQAQDKAATTTPPAQNTSASGKTIAKGTGEVVLGGVVIGLAIALAPETGGGSLAALAVVGGVLGGTAEVGNGIVDIAHGAGQVDAQTAEEAKQGINIANNPAAANALIVTNANNAERIGNVANGIMAAHDLATRPTGVADAFNKLLGAKDVKEGYQSGKELMHQAGSWVQNHAESLYQYF